MGLLQEGLTQKPLKIGQIEGEIEEKVVFERFEPKIGLEIIEEINRSVDSGLMFFLIELIGLMGALVK